MDSIHPGIEHDNILKPPQSFISTRSTNPSISERPERLAAASATVQIAARRPWFQRFSLFDLQILQILRWYSMITLEFSTAIFLRSNPRRIFVWRRSNLLSLQAPWSRHTSASANAMRRQLPKKASRIEHSIGHSSQQTARAEGGKPRHAAAKVFSKHLTGISICCLSKKAVTVNLNITIIHLDTKMSAKLRLWMASFPNSIAQAKLAGDQSWNRNSNCSKVFQNIWKPMEAYASTKRYYKDQEMIGNRNPEKRCTLFVQQLDCACKSLKLRAF